MNSSTIDRLNRSLEGRYRVERELGEGGMATVYLADDLRHERKVALKVLKPELAAVVGAQRFLAEIKTTANLQHPHILPLFDSGEADSFLFYVMPFVEGESLRERLDREQQLPVDDAVQIAKNIAEALDYAHKQGVIHRDIKPANILLQSGKPVISDFGIALAVGAAGGGRLTETGLSLGTPHYMSPEQATGDVNVGPPTDLYALGCVLYEMLAGEPPFTGSTPQAVLGKIIAGERPVVSESRPSAPEHVDAVILKALEKVPADRFSSAGALVAALDDTGFRVEAVRATADERGGRPLWPTLAALFATTTILALWVALQRAQPSTGEPVIAHSVSVPAGYTVDFGQPNLALAPGGSSLVFANGTLLYRHDFDDFESSPIPGTSRTRSVFFSPDGQSIGFNQDDALKTMALDGSPALTIATGVQTVMGAAWGEDGSIVYAPVLGTTGLRIIPADGGASSQLTTLVDSLAETAHRWPVFLPGGRRILYTANGVSNGWADSRLVVIDLDTGEQTVVMDQATSGRVLPPGYLVYAQDNGALEAAPFDLETLEVSTPRRPVIALAQLGSVGGASSFALSETGTIAFVEDSIWDAQALTLVDRAGNMLETVIGGLYADYPRFSPDGNQIGITIRQARNDDIAVVNVADGRRSPKSSDVAEDETPIWSPDGDRLAYTMKGPGLEQYVYVGPASPGAPTQRVFAGDYHHHLTSWSPDGRFIAYHEFHPERGEDVWAFDVESGERTAIDTTGLAAQDGRFSPDGRWVAYSREDDADRHQIRVVPFPNPNSTETASQQLTTNGGVGPVWSPDGTELFYFQGTTLMALPVSIGDAFSVDGPPVPLFPVPNIAINDITPDYDVHPSDRSFVLLTDERAPTEIRVIHNWSRRLIEVLSR